MACCINPAGAMRCSRKLRNRSMTKASATMEQINKGQIGQPAACMIENNAILRVQILCGHYVLDPIHSFCG